jgi:hypothetical protein
VQDNKQQAVRAAILKRIKRGVYAGKLPSIQVFAKEFSVNAKTVYKVIRGLGDQGLVESRGPRGTYVANASSNPLKIPPAWTDLDGELYRIATEIFSRQSGSTVVHDASGDVVRLNAGSVAALAEHLLPLDDYADEDFLSLFNSDAKRFFTYDGKLYGLPLTLSPYLLYYSVEHFASLGLARPGPFQTIDEFLDVCVRLVEKAGAKYAFAAYERFTYLLPFLWQGSVELVEADGLKGRLHAPEVKQALTFYQKLHRYSVSGVGEHNAEAALAAFLKGELAMLPWGGWMENWLAGEPRGRFGVCPLEIAGRRDTLLFSEAFAIAKDCAEPAKAWRFLKALFSPEAQAAVARSGVQIPAFTPGARPVPRIFVEMLAEAHPGGRRLPIEIIDLMTFEWKGFLKGEEAYDAFAARVSPALEVVLAHIERRRGWKEQALAGNWV